MVRFFLEAGVDALITTSHGWTPLYDASANAHLECVKLLLVEYKAHPSLISDMGKTPLDLVIARKPRYDWFYLGWDSKHYLNGQPYKAKEWDLCDRDRLAEIRRLLENNGAMTSEELYSINRSKFSQVTKGQYAGGGLYGSEDSSYHLVNN
ncbi:hypothetical protein UVI_02003650 [Ustilaginoidea virens]|uniref:Ankyrin repeat protein n=1 Tax=Ustilaginoidea virens TaxID=1159556 RepID=A0A1B5L246_USTVR|nr:hypothetical protein UVI_02003650 [Ustilaginoidea virens]